MRNTLGKAILGTALVMTLAGCGASGGNESGALAADTVGQEPVSGGTLVFADIIPPTNFQTQKAQNYQVNNVLNSILDRLVFLDPETKEIIPWIAESFEANDEATEYTFTIRDGVTFSDGEALDAEAVKANLDFQGEGDADKGLAPNVDFIGYESSEVEGNTVTVMFDTPNSNFLRVLSAVNAGLVSPKTLELDAEGQSSLDSIVGSGPFTFESQVPDQEIVLAKRAEYAWAPDNAENQEAAYLDKVVVRYIQEAGLRGGAISSGQADVVRGLQPADEATVAAAGAQVVPVPGDVLTTNAITLRPAAPGLEDVRVRQALQIGFDREAMSQTVLSDSHAAAESILNHDVEGFMALDLDYDPKRAAQLLDEAGWARGTDGIREKGSQKLEVTITASNNSVVVGPAIEFVETQWRELGVQLNNRTGDNAFFNGAYTNDQVHGLVVRVPYQGGLGTQFGNEESPWTLYEDPTISNLFAKELATLDESKRADILAEQQEALVTEEAILIPLFDEAQVHGIDPSVHIDFTAGTAPILQGAWKTDG